MKNKKGFVLIEIIISVMLLCIVGLALLKANSNLKNIYSIVTNKLEFSKYVSILSNQHTIEFHNKDIDLYELIKNRYTLKDEVLISILKDTKVHYWQEYKSMILLNSQSNENAQVLNIIIDEMRVSSKQGVSRYLTVKLQ